MAPSPAPSRYQKIVTLRTHDAAFSSEDVLFNQDSFAEYPLWAGDFAQITPVVHSQPLKPFSKKAKLDGVSIRESHWTNAILPENSGEDDDDPPVQTQSSRAYVFVVKDAPKEIKDKDPNLRLSISSTIAQVFGLRAGQQVLFETADRDSCVASHVELTFRDEYLSRGDMWRLATAELSERTVYKDQKVNFLNTIRATVKNVYINGKTKMSGYFATDTKPIFRSESARYTLFIQMSKEMWEFDTESSGEIMFNKVIHGFLPELFKKWMSINAHHLVNIILFARMEYQEGDPQPRFSEDVHSQPFGASNPYQDFYRVVVSDMASNDWVNILDQLKREFLIFLQEISVQRQPTEETEDGQRHILAGRVCEAYKGNLLEAINLASSQFSRDYIDRDLVRTGISIVVITAGSGYFEVGYDMLKLTTDLLMGSGIGIDLVCLAPMPLHSVPLFAYRNPRILESTVPTQAPSPSQSFRDNTPRQHELMLRKQLSNAFGHVPVEPKAGEWSFAIPHWVDVSYWKGETNEEAMQMKKTKSTSDLRLRKAEDAAYQPRVRLYNLQMGGLMENEMTSISIAKMHENPLHPWHRLRHQISGKPVTKETETRIAEYEREWMEEYDDYIFRPVHEKKAIEEAARKRAQKNAADDSRLTMEARGQEGSLGDDMPTGQPVGSYRPGSGFLDWKMNQKPVETPPSTARRKQSIQSLMSTATTETATSRAPSRKLLRQISFGGSPYRAPEPTVSTDLSAAGVIKPVTFAKQGENVTTPKTTPTSKVSQQFRALLSRSNSQASTPSSSNLKAVPEESKESSRPIQISAAMAVNTARVRAQHARQSSDEIISSSAETLKGSARGGMKREIGDDPEAKLAGLAHLRKNIPYLSSSADAKEPPATVSLTRALSPWLNLLNPCNPKKEDFHVESQFTRWQHVFPKARRTDTVKWKSLCYPASVPLTNDYFPTAVQLASEYHENFYQLFQETENDPFESREHLVRELIAFRLAHGFQVVVGESVSDFLGNKKNDLARVFDKSYMAQDGATLFMTVGSTIHQLLCGADGKVEIRRFSRKPIQEYESYDGSNAVSYQPLIKTVIAKDYEPRQMVFKNKSSEYNWNIIDNFIAGYSDDFSDALRFWRARFVLIPVEIPARRGLSSVREYSDEELRLEGIRKLTLLWQRHRVLPEEEKAAWTLNKRKDPNPLAIEYRTKDPSAVIAAGTDSFFFADAETDMLPPAETHTKKTYKIEALAEELQGSKGVKIFDRRWHWRLHYNCFVGSDMASWLLLNFKDIDTREAAVDFGNQLMKEGLFVHVRDEKDFRDGQYFYQIADKHATARPESRMGWLYNATRSGLRSVPPTPAMDRDSSDDGIGPQLDGTTESKPEAAEELPPQPPERRKIHLSKVMKYDVDPRHRSYRPEIINLHYDRLHNPDNCYHLRIDWMNVTSKFIEDAIVNWATTVRSYGLKLVELPIAEACAITQDHPFRAPYLIKLAKSPPTFAGSFEVAKKPHDFVFHKALLKKLDFVLDVESASSFAGEVDVMYSWGKPDYKLTQYIHKSGVCLAQITKEGNFLLLANRLYSDRGGAARREAGRAVNVAERELDRRGGPSLSRKSPMASPAMRPIVEGSVAIDTAATGGKKAVSAEEIKDEVEKFCSDVKKLEAFYREQDKVAVGTPQLQAVPSVPELNLPPMRRGLH